MLPLCTPQGLFTNLGLVQNGERKLIKYLYTHYIARAPIVLLWQLLLSLMSFNFFVFKVMVMYDFLIINFNSIIFVQ